MEELIVKYIAKYSSVGMFDGIEKADDPYEWALSQFKNCPKMPKNKEGKVANALQALFASYKVTKKRLEEMKTENKLLNSQVSNNVIEKLWGWRHPFEGTDSKIEKRNVKVWNREGNI